MAEQGKEAAAGAATETKGKKFSTRTALVLGAALLIEGVVISAAFMLAGKPAEAGAQGAEADERAMANAPAEELVVAERFQNMRSGRTYIYDSEIYVVVREKDRKRVKEQLAASKRQISAEIGTVFRRAEPAHLLEPTLTTVTRQIKAVLDEKIGRDEDGKPVIQQVLITKCTQFRADL